ncbi:RNA polymerase sigma-70 factor, ECF subfamily [Fodinibius salinus]|uniref:RNA polymerase sigma factor n=1 Tax=Fodinibius salinus TaxID=860790 RepID=A0A5D3YJW4_9BACT|nr:RNA polymerase sigma-70 factor [Fodinibius salinus]TYP92800.1 RNA polymerase sigma-70 factor, ECF subfamily [Fodinibius salinus]
MTIPLGLSLILLSVASSKDKELDSTALARQIRKGNHQAFRTFFDKHYDSLLRFLVSKNTTKEAAEDLIQKAFIYIWENRQSIDPEKSLRSYIFRIAYTRMLNHHRDNKKFNTEEPIPQQQTNLTPEDSAQKSDLEEAIDKAIDAMPEKRGTVFSLCFIEDLTYKEAAQTLEVSPKTIENHMGLALKDIRKSLENFR